MKNKVIFLNIDAEIEDKFEMVSCEDQYASHVIIDINKYHGYENALRIIRDRACQQIEKEKADEHGYTLLRADYRKYDYRREYKAFCITKASPYSISMPLAFVKKLIIDDLIKYYNYVELPMLKVEIPSRDGSYINFIERQLTVEHILDKLPRIVEPEDAFQRAMVDWREQLPDVISFELNKITGNYGKGIYEIGYWATDII